MGLFFWVRDTGCSVAQPSTPPTIRCCCSRRSSGRAPLLLRVGRVENPHDLAEALVGLRRSSPASARPDAVRRKLELKAPAGSPVRRAEVSPTPREAALFLRAWQVGCGSSGLSQRRDGYIESVRLSLR